VGLITVAAIANKLSKKQKDRREARLNGNGTPEERQKANEVLAQIIQRNRPKLVRRI